MRIRHWLVAAVLAVLLVPAAFADVKLPAVLNSNMVLQREKPLNIWGWADPGEKVTVTLAGQSKSTTADDQGNWRVTLDALSAGGPHTLVVKGKNQLKLEDILIGDVWICSGQSNMAWTVTRSMNPEQEIAAANYPSIRFFTVRREPKPEPQNDLRGKWQPVTPETAKGDLTAVGYFFARHLHQELGVPIGIIGTNWGGTRAEAWTPREHLVAEASLKHFVSNYEQALARYDAEKAEQNYQAALKKWKEQAAEAKAAGKRAPRKPSRQVNPAYYQHSPSTLYNGMIHPLINLPIRGAIWYQGESNVGRAYQYRTLFPIMIQSWRERWGEQFPFYFVQLAPFDYNRGGTGPHLLPEQWESQLLTLKNVPDTGMAVITDIGNIKDIHPRNKQDVGRRLALWALAKEHGKDLVYSGPIYDSVKFDGNKAIISFEHAKGLASSDGKPLTHFTVAGEDQEFHPATATIRGDKIVVTSDKVAEPVAVRFAWSNVAEPNLVNGAGLPASPFRTDDWPLHTRNNK